MACGTGVCRGCPLPRSASGRTRVWRVDAPSLLGNRDYAMCCTEGPVFDARRARLGADRVTRRAVDLSVRIGPITLANPVLTASGTFGYGDEYAHLFDPARLGAVITKTVTPEPRVGNPPERIAETAGGMLNSIGLENVGLAEFREAEAAEAARARRHRDRLARRRDAGANWCG